MLSLARGGAGLGYLPEPYVQSPVRTGDLRLVLEDWSSTGAGFQLYYPGRRQLPTGLRVLIDLIREMQPLGLRAQP